MKHNRSMVPAVLLIFSILVSAGAAFAGDEVVVVATPKTFEASAAWAEYLEEQEVPLKHMTPQAFAADKKAPFVVIMGSLDETDGVKALVAECLSKTEFQRASQVDTGEVFFKSKTWAPNQSIIVITGSDWPSTEAARKDYREEWLDELGKWFDLDLSGPTMHSY